jgi:paraquat-inducible protein B
VALRRTLAATNQLADRLEHEVAPEVRSTLVEARRALGDVDQVLASDAPLEQDLRQSLNQLTRAAEALRSLADYLDRHPEALLRGKERERSP